MLKSILFVVFPLSYRRLSVSFNYFLNEIQFRCSNNMYSAGKNFVLTKDTGRLSFEQRCFYESNGYIVIPRFIPSTILDKCSQRFDDIATGKVDRGNITVMREVSDRNSVNKNINHDDVLREYIEYQPMLDILETFTGPNIMAVHSMLIAKPPDSGSNTSRHPPPQDLYYFHFRPVDRIVAAWTAIETCDTFNGCLFVSPGSHNAQKLYVHDYPEGTMNKFYHGIHIHKPSSLSATADLLIHFLKETNCICSKLKEIGSKNNELHD